MDSHRDRREFTRIPRMTVITIAGAGDKDAVPGLMVDVSLGGMKILTQLPLEEENRITL